MNDTNTGGPAFPGEQQAILINSEHRDIAKQYKYHCNGMTLRQYAAIHLKVPNSGTDWLDDMIKQANKIDAELLTHVERSNTL